MNREHILELAAHVERLTHEPYNAFPRRDDYFAMDRYRYLCNSPSCIAGHAAALSGGAYSTDPFTRAREHLGLTYEQAHLLFLPADLNLAQITPQDAARALRHLADTGEVSWDIATDTKGA